MRFSDRPCVTEVAPGDTRVTLGRPGLHVADGRLTDNGVIGRHN